ncbi:unnamed protein product [Durusdinium trenchii]|uniref:EF-hand domain-containing protein n=1 Tax=Durusdinium trenchii TaxID=1381693 RepID=A0ABP0PRR5_9DINO
MALAPQHASTACEPPTEALRSEENRPDLTRESSERPVEVDAECLADRIRAIFDRFDKGGTGTLDRLELHQAFKTLIPAFTAKQITDYYKELVKGNDGAAVSREEFCEWILKGGGIAETVFKALMKETSDVLATSVREVFARFDVSGDGKLDMRELWRVFKSLDGRLRLRDLAALSQELDTGGDGTVSVREFLQWLRHGSERASALARVIVKETGKAREVRIRNAFQKYDATGDGVLDIEELATTLKVLGSFSSDEIKHVRADLDRSGDGSVSFDEFSTWIKCGKGRREVLKAKAILAPSDGDGMEAVFYNFCGPGHADMNGMNFTRFCKDCGLLDGPMDSVMADLIFSDTRVKDHAARTIDPLQFEFALEILAEKKHLKLAELRAKVLLQGAPKKLMAHHEDHHPEGKQRRNSFSGLDETQLRSGYKKPPRCSSQKRIAALLKRSHEVPGQESWRRDVDNSQLWKVFGLHTAAGRNLKKLYQPPLSVPLPGRSRSRLGDSDKENFQNTWSSPFLATRAGPGGRPPGAPKLAW